MKRYVFLKISTILLVGMNILMSCNFPAGDPVITGQTVNALCGAEITYVDHAPSDSYVFLRRSNNGTQYYDIKMAMPKGNQSAAFVDEGPLPQGTYYYKVGYFTNSEIKYSDASEAVVIDDDSCGTDPLVNKPLNPIIINQGLQGSCDAFVHYVIYAEDEDGVRVYRSSLTQSEAMIADLTPAQVASSAGFYYDHNLSPNTYRYRLSTYNENGESFSEQSGPVVITDQSCNPDSITAYPYLYPYAYPYPIDDLTLATPTLVPPPCTWEALINVYLRTGPGIDIYEKEDSVVKGTQLPIVGQSEDGFFWVVEYLKRHEYVSKSERVGKTIGDCTNVPTLRDPEPPEIAPTKTTRDKPVPTPIPQCKDGIDNDGDGLIDMRDLKSCQSPDDPYEN